MDIRRTTVPGSGIIHHYDTRQGDHVGVMVFDDGRRALMIYDGGDADVPSHVVDLDGDEADWVAELLHSRSLADRLSAVERRLAQLIGRRS
ncbi:hypothetical protein E1267_38820 [Nonomuraea longispora]|uniref:Potassium/proton antiporter subunit KhtT-like N-terminal domain-containing protein n=2 Tax=Nonomuraea longispora TaxID=1848320 RepID=A0A4R4MV15_9ACTN|nr:hypothetical protein E1267_38820 [Nonomuraea longispora]